MVAAYAPRIHIDLGSGDGKGPYRMARSDPNRLFVAVDLNAEALLPMARRAARQETKGGVRNLLCLGARPQELSSELRGVADRVSIILPWGELLRGVAAPEPELLQAVADACQPDAAIEIVFSYDARRDTAKLELPALPGSAVSASSMHGHIETPYRRAGLRIQDVARLPERDLRAYPTTWAQRLAHGRPRVAWRIRATR